MEYRTLPGTLMFEAVECKVEPSEDGSGSSVVREQQVFEVVECKEQPPESNTGSDWVRESQIFEAVDCKVESSEGNTGPVVVQEAKGAASTTCTPGSKRSVPLTVSTVTGHISSFAQCSHKTSEQQQNASVGPSFSGEGSEKKMMEKLEKQHAQKKLLSGDWVVRPKTGSRVIGPGWERFGEIFEKSTNRYTGFVQCFSCSNIKIFKKGASPSCLTKHQCGRSSTRTDTCTAEVSSKIKIKFRDACANVSAGDIRPFTTFTGPYFRNLVQLCIDLGARYGSIKASELLCDPGSISCAVASRANAAKDEVLPEVLKAVQKERVAATTDFWNDCFTKNHYLTLNVHYIDQNWNHVSRVLFTRKFSQESETAENINEGILQESEKMGLTPEMLRTVTFVTDDDANIVKALSLMKVQHLYCSAHCINVVLKAAFTLNLADLNLYGDAGQKIVELARLAVAFARYSDKSLKDSLTEVPSQTTGIFESSLPALESLKRNFEQVCQVLRLANQKQLAKDLEEHFSDLKELISFIEPIESAARACGNFLECADLSWLSLHIGEKTEDSSFMRTIKAHFRKELAVIDCLQLINKCKQIVMLFICLGVGERLEIALKHDIETRWNSKLLILFSFPDNFEEINYILETHSQHHLILSPLEQQAIQEIVSLLTVFKEETDKMECERAPAVQYVLLSFTRLVKHCSPVDTESVPVRNLKSKLQALLREKFVPHILQKVAVFLWPQFRRLKMLTEEERKEVHAEIRKLWATIPLEDNVPEPVVRPPPKRSRNDGYDEWRVSDEEEEDEIEAYLRDSPGDDQDLLKWWQSKEHRYPKLANVARKILGIPATSPSSERVFSTGEQLLSARRSSISSTDVDSVLFLNSYFRNIYQKRKRT